MVSTTRKTAPARRRHIPVTPAPDPVTGAAERWFWYLHLIRAARSERHYRACRHCAPGSELAQQFGTCPIGLRMAQSADSALDAALKLAGSPALAPASAGTLW